MIYQATITTPKGTDVSDPLVTRLGVNKGLVYKVEIFFPYGSQGTLYCMIADGAYQAWPTTPFEYFRGDKLLIAFDDPYIKNDPPYEFQIYTYNTDANYDHTVIVRVGLVSHEIFMARFLPTYTYDYFLRMITQLNDQQKEQQQQLLENPFYWLNTGD
jgi:hypothetical protein